MRWQTEGMRIVPIMTARAAQQASDPLSDGNSFASRYKAVGEAVGRAQAAACAASPIDHVHLARYTLGDRDLELEILELFLGEAPRTLASIRELTAPGSFHPEAWITANHTLKGSARAVGATRVAAAAERSERLVDPTPADLYRHMTEISAALDEVIAYMAQWKQSA